MLSKDAGATTNIMFKRFLPPRLASHLEPHMQALFSASPKPEAPGIVTELSPTNSAKAASS